VEVKDDWFDDYPIRPKNTTVCVSYHYFCLQLFLNHKFLTHQIVMAFDGFEEFVLNDDSLALFEELYTHHVGEDIDRLNFAMSKVNGYVKEHNTFGRVKDLLDLLVSKAATVHEDTLLCEDNYAFVWSHLATILNAKGASLGLQTVEEKMRETVKQHNMPVSYLLAIGNDAARSIQKQLNEAEAKEKQQQAVKEAEAQRLEEEEEAKKMEEDHKRTHPTDPEERRKLFASRFK